MSSGLVSQALRRNRWSLLAPAVTQILAACVISAMVMTAWSLSPSQLPPGDRAVVVASEMDDVTSVFLGSAIYLSILIVGVTMNLAIQQQLQDIALVRVVGASPGQVRRAVALQVAAVAAIYVTFAGVAAVNCLVTVVVNRRSDLAPKQLLGADRQTLIAASNCGRGQCVRMAGRFHADDVVKAWSAPHQPSGRDDHVVIHLLRFTVTCPSCPVGRSTGVLGSDVHSAHRRQEGAPRCDQQVSGIDG